jgi:hypothetical protein
MEWSSMSSDFLTRLGRHRFVLAMILSVVACVGCEDGDDDDGRAGTSDAGAMDGGRDGDAGRRDFLMATVGGEEVCPSGYHRGVSAVDNGSSLAIVGDCGRKVRVHFGSGGVECRNVDMRGYDCVVSRDGEFEDRAEGSAEIAEEVGAFRVRGSCECAMGVPLDGTNDFTGPRLYVEFDLPLEVE